MSNLNSWRRILILGAILSLVAGLALAQSPTGNVYGTVTDADGEALPGVTVSIEGIGADKMQITDAQGQFRFLALDPGVFTLKAELEGFGKVEYPGVEVRIGRNTTIPLVLQAAVEETITVTSESPLLDERQLSQGTTVTQVELERIPSARDPWAIVGQTPGVLVDRVNVGGSESGQQSAFRAQGVSGSENDFAMDGVQITDMRAIGASTSYFDFDQFAEMQFTTGGTDVTKTTSGVGVNLVTKRGSNEFRGSARFFNTKANGYFGGALKQADVNVSESDLGPNQSPESYVGAQIREIEEMGFEAGGAVVRDRFWMWGSWGQNDIQQNASSGTADDTILENTSLKANAQFTQANSFVASWNNGDKQKFGRGAGTTRPDATTWNQRGPTAFYRFEDTHVFSSNFFLTGTYALGDTGFALAAKAGVGPGNPESWRRSDGVWQDNYQSGSASAPTEEFKADASYFFNTGNTNHELKVGGRFRSYETQSAFLWPGRNIFTYNTTSTHFVVAQRGVATPTKLDYFSLWAQDTISMGRFTFNAGLRWDDQKGKQLAATVPGNAMVPNVLPDINYPGKGSEFAWTNLAPRLGVTYALGSERDTLIRASLAQFADQLSAGTVNRTNPAGTAYAYFALDPYVDGPYTGDGSELNDPNRVDAADNFDPQNPTSLVGANVTDGGLEAPLTTELVASVEHALLPEFVIGLTLTARQVKDIEEERDYLRDGGGGIRTINADDYVQDGTLNGSIDDRNAGGAARNFSIPVYALRDDFDFTGGSLLLNGSRKRDYFGGAFNFTKRLANRWMMRGYFNYGKAEWDVPLDYERNSNPNPASNGGDVDGQTYVERSTGSGKGERFLQSTWSANLTGLYQVMPDRPWGFNVSGALTSREGYPLPYFDQLVTSDGQNRSISVVNDFTDYRLPNLTTIDLRLEKEFNLTGPVNMTFGIDAFNITNTGAAMSRNRNLAASNIYWLADNVSPRIYRLGVRLSWK